MFLRGTLLSVALVGVFGSLGGAAAAQAPTECFAGNPVTKVVPHHVSVLAGQGPYQQLAGARAYVPARPGLTGEWLHALLARRSSQPRAGSECPLDVPGVKISVQSAGPGFWVSLTAAAPEDGKEVLRRAQQLTR